MNFAQLTPIPQDPILEIFHNYLNDTNPNKVNLSIGMYYDEENKLYQFNAVSKASALLSHKEINKGYLPITGHPGFNQAVTELVFGKNNSLITENKICTVQTLAASCGLRIIGEFAYRFLNCKRIFVSNPTWSNHHDFFNRSGLTVLTYNYYSLEDHNINFDKTYKDLEEKLQENDLVLLHAVCHNPSGADFTEEQWDKLNQLFHTKKVLPIFDMAYLGYGKSLEEDSYCLKSAQKYLNQFINIFSCSKSFSMYGDRIGAVSVVCNNSKEKEIVASVLSHLIRSLYSTPIIYGALIVESVLTVPELYQLWTNELTQARDRLQNNRKALVTKLQEHGINQFNYVLEQKGFFSLLPFKLEQIQELRNKYSIYLLDNGRINFAGINANNINYIVESFIKILA